MTKTKKIKEAKGAPAAAPEAAKPERDHVTVLWAGLARVFRRDIHGDNFLELAKSFAAKHHGLIE